MAFLVAVPVLAGVGAVVGGIVSARKKKQDDHDARKKLKEYVFGNRLGSVELKPYDIEDIKDVNILVLGPIGSGKSCFIATAEMALGPKEYGTTLEQSGGFDGTQIVEEFLYDCGVKFRLVDFKGLHSFDSSEIKEVRRIVYGSLEEQYGKTVSYDNNDPAPEFPDVLSKIAHGVIFILKLDDCKFAKGGYRESFEALRNFLLPIGITPVTVITCEDEIPTYLQKPDNKNINLTIEAIRDRAANITGSPRDHVFFISNYRKNVSTVEDFARNNKVYEIMWQALQSAEQYVKIQKQRQSRM